MRLICGQSIFVPEIKLLKLNFQFFNVQLSTTNLNNYEKILMLMVCAIMISMNLSYAQSVARTQSASINPTEIYVEEETDIFTVIAWLI